VTNTIVGFISMLGIVVGLTILSLAGIYENHPIKLINETNTYHEYVVYNSFFTGLTNRTPIDTIKVEIDPKTCDYKGFGYYKLNIYNKKYSKIEFKAWQELVNNNINNFTSFITSRQ